MSSNTDQKRSPLSRYIAVLEAVAAGQTSPGLSEIAQSSGFPLGSAHRLVAGLLSADLLMAEGTTRKTYRLGSRLLRLVHAGTEEDKIRAAVQASLERVADRVGETCFLARLSGKQVISIAWAVPERGVRVLVVPGEVMPAHAAASAKAIMAFQKPEFIDAVLAERRERFTPFTKTRSPAIKAEYARVREQRYAVCWDELEVGLAAVACPIELPDAGVIYALGISGIGERISRRTIEAVHVELLSVLPDVERALRTLSATPKADLARPRRPSGKAVITKRRPAEPEV